MMHQNKLISKLYKLKRKLCSNYDNDKSFFNLRYISYSIPLGCIGVLLFGLVYGIIFVDSGFNNEEVFAESITSSNSNASLTIAENDLHTTAAPGSVAYTSTNISYSTTNVENYTLKISYANGSSALVGDSADATAISDIANSTLSDNSWGYAWSDNSNIDENSFDGLTYSSVPSYNNGNNLASGSTNISNGTGKLVFAARFASNAVTTNYKTSVLLALATTPKAVTYTITYNSDGGTAVSSTTKTSTNTTETLTISSTTPTKTGYDFVNWKNSSNNTYNPGDNITMVYSNSTVVLTAVWEAKSYNYKVIYDMNPIKPTITEVANPEGIDIVHTDTSYAFNVAEPTSQYYTRYYNGISGTVYTYNFQGWSTDPTATTKMYSPGDNITLTSDGPTITLYGVWRRTGSGSIS